jgi:hypothetical protein
MTKEGETMRNKLSIMSSILLVPLLFGWAVARAADQPDAGGFRVLLLDGSQVNGAVSLVINLDTPYGQIKIPSSSLVSARFDVDQKWADIQLNDAQLKLKYNPASSDVKATTAVGALTIGLSNVITVVKGSADLPSATAPKTVASQPSAPPPAATYAQQQPQQPPVAAAPTYQYPNPYPYVAPAPSYAYVPDYSYSAPYAYSPYYGYGYGYGWPYFGFGFGWGRGYGGFHGGGFHGGGHGGGGHR